MRYLHLQEQSKLLKLGLMAGMLLSAVAAIGSQSRGALVGLLLAGSVFWFKSRKKLMSAVLVVVTAIVVIAVMPESWYQRMDTIETYSQDDSALGRINAWGTALNVANHRFFGGGFEMWHEQVFQLYGPDPSNVRDAHSIYFKVLGEHGYVGLLLFLALLAMTWFKCRAVIQLAKHRTDALWASDLAAMIQVSMVAYMSAGAFLGLSYFDYIYHLVAVTVVVHHLLTVPQPATVGPAQPRVQGHASIAKLSTLRQHQWPVMK
jgi:putative inorganic carbon (HCO3(-)) transporter